MHCTRPDLCLELLPALLLVWGAVHAADRVLELGVAPVHHLQCPLQRTQLLLQLADASIQAVALHVGCVLSVHVCSTQERSYLALELLSLLSMLDDKVGLCARLAVSVRLHRSHDNLVSLLKLLDLCEALVELWQR